ncbi:hypothetical protein KJ603_01315 [Patescibacteria group bacterium]|nr:hypothetical protein [Patescibacteria group bacterium]
MQSALEQDHFDDDPYVLKNTDNFFISLGKIVSFTDVFNTKKICKNCGCVLNSYNKQPKCFSCLKKERDVNFQKDLNRMNEEILTSKKTILCDEIITLVSNFFDLDEYSVLQTGQRS